MTEGTPRLPHTRTYIRDGKTAEHTTDDHGFVQISEELLDQLLTELGFTETTTLTANRTDTTMTSAFQLAPAHLSVEDLRIEALRLASTSGAINSAETVRTAAVYLDFLLGNADH